MRNTKHQQWKGGSKMTLAIGFNSDTNYHFSAKLDFDPDLDPPRKLHDLLKKAAGIDMRGEGFTKLVCFDDDGIEGDCYEIDVDYDLDEELEEELDDDIDDDDDSNPDGLHDEDEDD
jgi:hypothetical protein